MPSAIVYQSLTGSCKRYAELLSARLHIPCHPVGKYKAREGAEVIFVGWAFAGKAVGYAKANEKYNIAAVVLVGMGAVNEGSADFGREANNVPDNVAFFCVQGGFHLQKLPFPYRLIMKIKCKDIVKRLEAKETLSEQDMATYKMASTGDGEPASWDIDEIVSWAKG